MRKNKKWILILSVVFLSSYGFGQVNPNNLGPRYEIDIKARAYVVDYNTQIAAEPFIILSDNHDEVKFLSSVFSPNKVTLQEESKWLNCDVFREGDKWRFPNRISQKIKLEDKEYEISFIPFGDFNSISYRIIVSFLKEVVPDKNEILMSLEASSEKNKEGQRFSTEVKAGEFIYICFPLKNKIYLISFSTRTSFGGFV